MLSTILPASMHAASETDKRVSRYNHMLWLALGWVVCNVGLHLIKWGWHTYIVYIYIQTYLTLYKTFCSPARPTEHGPAMDSEFQIIRWCLSTKDYKPWHEITIYLSSLIYRI